MPVPCSLPLLGLPMAINSALPGQLGLPNSELLPSLESVPTGSVVSGRFFSPFLVRTGQLIGHIQLHWWAGSTQCSTHHSITDGLTSFCWATRSNGITHVVANSGIFT